MAGRGFTPTSGNATIGRGISVTAGGKVISSRGITIRLEGTTPQDVAASVARLGKIPAGAMSAPVIKGATKVKRMARMLAPKRSGLLRQGIVVRPGKERTRYQGKLVKDIWMDPKLSDSFAKYSNGKRYYYPASMEYGFRLQRGGRWPGLYYMRTAAKVTEDVYEQFVLDEFKRKLDQAWLKKSGGAEK